MELKPEVYWEVEEWVPPENAIGEVGYWCRLNDGRGLPARLDFTDGLLAARRAHAQRRAVRLVKVERTVERAAL